MKKHKFEVGDIIKFKGQWGTHSREEITSIQVINGISRYYLKDLGNGSLDNVPETVIYDMMELDPESVARKTFQKDLEDLLND